MEECKIILPTGPHAAEAHNWLRETLLRLYGGYTETEGVGAWTGPNGNEIENVRVYTVAVTRSSAIASIAHYAAQLAKQDSVYYTDVSGSVHIDGVS